MSDMYKEYNSTSVNPSPCYSNLLVYGSNGTINPIVNPTPAAVQPPIFNVLTPHSMPNHNRIRNIQRNKNKLNCYPYNNLSQYCVENDIK